MALEQRRWLVEVDDENIHVTVVVEIAESATPAAMYLRYGGPGLGDQFFETATPRLRKPTRSVVGICPGFNSWVR